MPLIYLDEVDLAEWRLNNSLARGYEADADYAELCGHDEAAEAYRTKGRRFRAAADAIGTPGLPPEREVVA